VRNRWITRGRSPAGSSRPARDGSRATALRAARLGSPSNTLGCLGAVLVALVLMAGCRTLPLASTIDLLPSLGDAAAGSVEAGLVAGLTTNLGLRLPSAFGSCLELDPLPPGVRVERAVLHYQVEVTYDGPEMRGEVRLQPFAAADGGLLDDASAVGAGIDVDLAAGQVVAVEDIPLTAAQLQAFDERRVCWGLSLTGDSLRPDADGVATIAYAVQELRLRVAFSLL
jgi:hypothetical protein